MDVESINGQKVHTTDTLLKGASGVSNTGTGTVVVCGLTVFSHTERPQLSILT